MLEYFGFYDTKPNSGPNSGPSSGPRSDREPDQDEAVVREPRSPQPTKPVVVAKAAWESSTALLR